MEEYATKIATLVPENISDDKLLDRIVHYYNDRVLVQVLLDPSDIRHGDAWEGVIQHIKAIVLRRIGNQDNPQIVLEECIQNANIDVIKGVKRFEFNSLFSTWLFTVVNAAVNQVIRKLYTKKRTAIVEPLEDTVPAQKDQQPEEQTQATVLVDLIRQVLAQHPDKRLEHIFVLAEIEERTKAEIGQLLHLSESRIRALLLQAKRILREDLSLQQWHLPKEDKQSPEEAGESPAHS